VAERADEFNRKQNASFKIEAMAIWCRSIFLDPEHL
jgi:hypothetical protein